MPNSNQGRSNPGTSANPSQARGNADSQNRGNAESDRSSASRSQSNGAAARGATSRAGAGGETGNGRTSNRGFASMDPQRQREIASQGGRAAHASGNAHQFNSEEARAAGRKGGEANRNRATSDRSPR